MLAIDPKDAEKAVKMLAEIACWYGTDNGMTTGTRIIAAKKLVKKLAPDLVKEIENKINADYVDAD